ALGVQDQLSAAFVGRVRTDHFRSHANQAVVDVRHLGMQRIDVARRIGHARAQRIQLTAGFVCAEKRRLQIGWAYAVVPIAARTDVKSILWSAEFAQPLLSSTLVCGQIRRDAVLCARLATIRDATAGASRDAVFVTDRSPVDS